MRKNSRARKLLAWGGLTVGALVVAPDAGAMTTHEGWPTINGVLLMNKTDHNRPLDARPDQDMFGGSRNRSCDGVHAKTDCRRGHKRGEANPRNQADGRHHNELLGGHGNDVIHAGPAGDVIWGDYKPSGQPTSQVDELWGGRRRDFIYASHGRNHIHAGGGRDWIKAHWGRGTIDCGPGRDILYVSRRAQPHYDITGCERISHETAG